MIINFAIPKVLYGNWYDYFYIVTVPKPALVEEYEKLKTPLSSKRTVWLKIPPKFPSRSSSYSHSWFISGLQRQIFPKSFPLFFLNPKSQNFHFPLSPNFNFHHPASRGISRLSHMAGRPVIVLLSSKTCRLPQRPNPTASESNSERRVFYSASACFIGNHMFLLLEIEFVRILFVQGWWNGRCWGKTAASAYIFFVISCSWGLEFVEVWPRLSFTTAWSSNAVSICRAFGLKAYSLAIMFRGMKGSTLGVWAAHGEGRAYFPYVCGNLLSRW